MTFVVVLGLCAICLLLVFPARLPNRDGGRSNILLLGIDRPDGNGWAYRTDTIMVFSMDPETHTAAMLSIPRDLQLAIPGHWEDRINTANVFGYQEDDPDAGPALLAATIEANFGIPTDGYIMVDFLAFEEIIDTLGGIDIYVEQTLHDTRYPDPRPGDPYAYKTIHFDPGPQHMDGERALEYARSRMSTTDFDRAKRQQQILLALRERATGWGGILHWPKLAATVRKAVQTDLSLGQLKAVGLFAVGVEPASLEQAVLEFPLVFDHRRADGAEVQLPNWDLIDAVIKDLFGPTELR